MTTRLDFRASKFAVRATALISAAVMFTGVYLLWNFFVATKKGQIIDNAAYEGSFFGKGRLWTIAEPLLNPVSVAYVAISIIVVVAIALWRKRWMLAVQVVTVIVGANLTTQVVKKFLLDRPDYGIAWYSGNTLPSGHTTAAAATSLALLLVVPRKWRPLTAILGGMYTTAMGVSTQVGQWHRPSDVFAAVLVAGAWATLVCAFSTVSSDDPHSHNTTTWTVTSVTLIATAAFVGFFIAYWCMHDAFAYWQTDQIADLDLQKRTYIGSAAAVGALTAVVFGFTLAIRQVAARMR